MPLRREGGEQIHPTKTCFVISSFPPFLLSISSCIIAETDRDHRSSGDSDHLAGQQRLPLFKIRIEREGAVAAGVQCTAVDNLPTF